MITKEFDLGNKVVIPMRLKSHSGKSIVTGTFFVYDDEGLAKKHIDPTIFTRLEKSKAKKAEAEKAEAPAETESPAETETPAEGTESKAEVAEPEESKEEKSE
jgi:uncharacterized protein YdaU (DUF1376 family)